MHGGSSSNSRVKFAYPHEMFANFTGDPYLSRASPIKLVDVNSSDPEVAQEIGVKSTILYLLGIIRDDARLDQQMYGDEAPNVKRIHDETVKSLSAQNKPISALPN